MRKGQRSHNTDMRRVYLHAILVISGNSSELDNFETKMRAGEFSSIIGPEPAQPVEPMKLPPIFNYKNKIWKEASLSSSNQTTLNLDQLHTAFHLHRRERPIQA